MNTKVNDVVPKQNKTVGIALRFQLYVINVNG